MIRSRHSDDAVSPVVWWLRPHLLILFFIVPLTLLVYLADLTGLQTWNWFFDFGKLSLVLVYLLLIVGGSYYFSRNIRAANPNFGFYIKFGYIDFLAIVAILAHVIWFRRIFVFLDFSLLNALLFQKSTHIREFVDTVPGLTTLTQAYLPFSAFYAINFASRRRISIPRRHHVLFVVVFFFVLFQAFAWGVRLALFEFMIPLVAVFLREFPRITANKGLRTLVIAGPLIALPAGFVLFAAFEYMRTWQVLGATYAGTYLEYSLTHFVLYYATSINNGAGLLETLGSGDFTFVFLFRWLYKLPVGIGPFFSDLLNADPNILKLVIETDLDPRFNTFTGIFPFLFDFGIFGGLLFAAAYGAVFGVCYRSFALGTGFGCALYPTMFPALFDILRIDYFFDGRYFYPLIFAVLGYFYFRGRLETEQPDANGPAEIEGTASSLGDRRNT